MLALERLEQRALQKRRRPDDALETAVELRRTAEAHLALEGIGRKLLVELGPRRRLRRLQPSSASREHGRDALDEPARAELRLDLVDGAARERLDKLELAGRGHGRAIEQRLRHGPRHAERGGKRRDGPRVCCLRVCVAGGRWSARKASRQGRWGRGRCGARARAVLVCQVRF